MCLHMYYPFFLGSYYFYYWAKYIAIIISKTLIFLANIEGRNIKLKSEYSLFISKKP